MGGSFDAGVTLADRMRRHAGDAEHLYGHLMRAMADDWDTGGPVREVCAGWESSPTGWVIQLRLLGGVFRIVLTGRAPELVPYYPCLGGRADPAEAWPVARAVIAAHVDELRKGLTIAPQTNEVGRANALLLGLFLVVERTRRSRVRLLEPGSSAGLNLLVDKYRFVNPGWTYGPTESPVVLSGAVEGEVRPIPFEIVDRRGCDVSPVDVTSEEGRLRLRSFVWPFHVERHQRLAGALAIAQDSPPVVDRNSAADWLEGRLSEYSPHDVITVVWQSITRQYWPTEEVARVESAIQAAAERSPIAHVSMEYPETAAAYPAELTVSWSAGSEQPSLTHERLGTVGDHGFPVTLGD